MSGNSMKNSRLDHHSVAMVLALDMVVSEVMEIEHLIGRILMAAVVAVGMEDMAIPLLPILRALLLLLVREVHLVLLELTMLPNMPNTMVRLEQAVPIHMLLMVSS